MNVPQPPLRLLALSGSLRAMSSNKAALRAAAALAPPNVEVSLYDGLAGLPHFNPDDEESPGAAVRDLQARVAAADGLLISCPEYAHGVPGSFKNALDWLVGGSEIVYKPIALINTAPRSTLAQAALVATLTAMSTRLVPEAFVALPLLGRKLNEAEILADSELAEMLRSAVSEFVRWIRANPAPV